MSTFLFSYLSITAKDVTLYIYTLRMAEYHHIYCRNVMIVLFL